MVRERVWGGRGRGFYSQCCGVGIFKICDHCIGRKRVGGPGSIATALVAELVG